MRLHEIFFIGIGLGILAAALATIGLPVFCALPGAFIGGGILLVLIKNEYNHIKPE
jgi:hypothetical protein